MEKISTETRSCTGGQCYASVDENEKRCALKTTTYFLDYLLKESSADPNTIVIDKGCIVEGPAWEIKFNMDATTFGDDKICSHVIETGRVDKYGHKIRILPRAVVAYNEAGCCSTSICLDCILNVAKCPIVKKRK